MSVVDPFARHADAPANPARDAFMVAPDDEAPLPRLPKALLVGTAGTLTLRPVAASGDIAFSVQAGQIVPIRASHVRATGTSAGEIVALV